MSFNRLLVVGAILLVVAVAVHLSRDVRRIDDVPGERDDVATHGSVPADEGIEVGESSAEIEAPTPDDPVEETSFNELVDAMRVAVASGDRGEAERIRALIIPLADRFATPLAELFVSDPNLASDVKHIALEALREGATELGLGVALGKVLPRMRDRRTVITVLYFGGVVLPDEVLVPILRVLDPDELESFAFAWKARDVRAKTLLAEQLFAMAAPDQPTSTRSTALSLLVSHGDRGVLAEVAALIGTLPKHMNTLAYRALAGAFEPREAIERAAVTEPSDADLAEFMREVAESPKGREALVEVLQGASSGPIFDHAIVALSSSAEEGSSEGTDEVRRALLLAWERRSPTSTDRQSDDERRGGVFLHLSNFMEDADFNELATRFYPLESAELRNGILSGLWNSHGRGSKTALLVAVALLAKESDEEVVREELAAFRQTGDADDATLEPLSAFFREWLRQGDRLEKLPAKDAAFARAILGD